LVYDGTELKVSNWYPDGYWAYWRFHQGYQ
jgi:hypothetical protein